MNFFVASLRDGFGFDSYRWSLGLAFEGSAGSARVFCFFQKTLQKKTWNERKSGKKHKKIQIKLKPKGTRVFLFDGGSEIRRLLQVEVVSLSDYLPRFFYIQTVVFSLDF